MTGVLPILVADIGGTNSRLALADAGMGEVRADTYRRYKNRDYGSFYEIVAAFLAAENLSACSACCVAVAGPVASQKARLTNLGWQVGAAELSAFTDGGRSVLINDLVALGYGIGHLPGRSLTPVVPMTKRAYFNGQSLIVGVGTGLNACVVRQGEAGVPVCFEAELGHSSLPLEVVEKLTHYFGAASAGFTSVEDCLSGRGLSRIHTLVSGGAQLDGAAIVAAEMRGDDPAARKTMQILAELTGAFSRELIFLYLPLNGIYFAGSVARGIFGNGAQAGFLAAFRSPTLFNDQLAHIPVSLVNDDAAALTGCLVALDRLDPASQ